jgi:hypothetical protein
MFDSHILYVIIDIHISLSKRNFKINYPTNQQLFPNKIFKKRKKKEKKKDTSHHGIYNGMMLGSNVYGSQQLMMILFEPGLPFGPLFLGF